VECDLEKIIKNNFIFGYETGLCFTKYPHEKKKIVKTKVKQKQHILLI